MLKILAKIAKLKKNLKAVTKSANNPFFKSKYADLNVYLDEVEPLIEAEGLLLLQPVTVDTNTGMNFVASIIYDVDSGESLQSIMRLVGDSDMQKLGSAVTYARRYTLGSLLGMKAIDDDANLASNKETKKTTHTGSTTKSPVESGNASAGPSTQAITSSSTTTRSSFRQPKKAASPASTGDDI